MENVVSENQSFDLLLALSTKRDYIFLYARGYLALISEINENRKEYPTCQH